MLWYLEGFLKDVGGFILHKKEIAVSFVFADLLHYAKVVDGREEIAPGKISFGFRRQFIHRIA